MTRAVLLAILLTAPLAHAAPTPTDALFERGNQAYLHGDHKAAVDAYQQVVALGVVHEDLFYALGNAQFQAGHLGPAIHAYERALSLDPSQEDAQANLRLARHTVAQRWQDRLLGAEADPWWMRALSHVTPGGLTLVFLVLYSILFLLLIAVYLLPSGFLRVAAAALLLFAALGTLGSGALLGVRWWTVRHASYAIVLPDEVEVKEGPDPNYQTSFRIHAGLRVRVVGRDQDWIKLHLQNGLEGWVHEQVAGPL